MDSPCPSASLDTPILAFAWKLFGTNYSEVEKHLAKGTKLHIYASAAGPCLRKDNCPEYAATEIEDIVSNAIEAIEWVRSRCWNCPLDVVVQLEDNLTNAEACHATLKIKEASLLLGLENIRVGRNPLSDEGLTNIFCYDFVELHQDSVSRFMGIPECTYSNDGADLTIPPVWNLPSTVSPEDVTQFATNFASRCNVLLWKASLNCLSGDSKEALLPRDRMCLVDRGTLEGLEKLIEDISNVRMD